MKLLRSPAAVLLGIIAVIAIGYLTGGWGAARKSGSLWFWLPLFCLVAAVAVIGTLWLIPRYREKRLGERVRSEDSKLPDGDLEESGRELREKILEVIQSLERSPNLNDDNVPPRYALPWYLLIGLTQAGKTTLLQGVTNLLSSVTHPFPIADGPTQRCNWWLFDTAVILDTPGRYILSSQKGDDRGEWHRLLALLRHYRELRPIDGLIVTVAADLLASKHPEEIRLHARELRKRIDEAVQESGVGFPVYLLITRCDLIDGFTEFFSSLPEQTRTQVLGYLNDTSSQSGSPQDHPPRIPPFEPMFDLLAERLQHLRLVILREKLPPPGLRQKVFCFVEEFRALREPLRCFVETLVGETPLQHTPFLRGVFFCSAQQQGVPFSLLRQRLHVDGQLPPIAEAKKVYFLRDFFSVILPRDRYLAGPTRESIRRRVLKHLLAFTGCIVLCLLLVVMEARAFYSDRATYAFGLEVHCPRGDGGRALALVLDETESCRQALQSLMERNQQRPFWSRWLFNASGRLERQLSEGYVEKFEAGILAPLDSRINQRLMTGAQTIPLVFLFIKRVELLNKCLSVSGCPASIDKDMQPDYELMLDPARQQPSSRRQVDLLQHGYIAYLHWASRSNGALRREQEAHTTRLHQWFSAKQFDPSEIMLWANKNYTAVRSQEYWPLPLPVGVRETPQVQGAYTRAAWEQGILPFRRRASDAVPALEPLLKGFERKYRHEYFEEWQHFLREFPGEGLPRWKTREERRQLTLKLLDDSSPFNRILDVAFVNLQPLLPRSIIAETSPAESEPGKSIQKWTRPILRVWQRISQLWGQKESTGAVDSTLSTSESDVPVWIRLLQRYTNSENRKALLDTLGQIQGELAGSSYRENSFKLALAGFQAGEPTEKSNHPVLKAWGIIDAFRDKEKSDGTPGEEALWLPLQRPVRLVWRAILEEAADVLQQRWAENVVAPAKGFSELEQIDFLYGPQGKVREFANQVARPFLTDNESRAAELLGEEIPLSPLFYKALRDQKQLEPILTGLARFPPQIRVEAYGSSLINSQTNIEEERTEFQLECPPTTFKVNNRPRDSGETATATVIWSFGSCGDTVVAISMSCQRACVQRLASMSISPPELSALRITKRYRGRAAFLHFIQDFSDGSHEFRINDFSDSHPPAEWQRLEDALRRYRVSTIRVFYRVEAPSTLRTLTSLIGDVLVPPTITR